MDAHSRPATGYRFLDWQYEPALRRLAGPAGATRIKPLSDRLLRCLLDAPGQMLARDHLIEQVWTRREVNDEVLSRAIAELRALLGDDAREPRYVETLSKGGYRWIAPVTRLVADAAGEVPPTPVPPNRRRHLVAGIAAVAVLLGFAALLVPRWTGEGTTDRAPLAVALLAARPLATDPRLESDARFDAAGRVVYVRAELDGAASELVLVDPATLAERVLWQDPGTLRHPAPSPDGSEVAVTRLTEDACEVWSVALVDLHRTRLGDCAAAVPGGMEWTDGGTGLIHTGVATPAQREPGLVLLDRRSGRQRVLTTPEPGEGAHAHPRLSFDGTRLVYASMHDGEGQLWQTDWPGLKQRTALLKRPDPVYGHAFEPGDEGLWIAGDLTRYRALHRLVVGGEPELIGGRGARSIDIAASGTVVWAEATYDADIWLRAHGDASWVAIARSNRYESQPEFSPDGQRVALISNRGGSESVFVFDRRDGGVRALPLDPEYRWVRPTWSLQENALIITAYHDRHTRLYRYRLDEGLPRAIDGIAEGAFHGIELADRLVYMTGNGGGRGHLMQRRADGAPSDDLGLGTVTAYRASPDWLVWRNEGSTSLRAAPWPALQPVREIQTADGSEALALAGQTLQFLDQGALWSLSLPDGARTRIASERLPNGNGPSLAATPDGALALVTLTSLSIDLMIAEMPAKAASAAITPRPAARNP
jgi:DNA-binding winged helix-turn-helix (wHTH) protein